MNQLTPFDFNGATLRVLGTAEEPLFVAKEVAGILGYADTSALVRYLDADERGTCQLDSSSGTQNFVTITESGLYSAVMRSTAPEAKVFKKWVTGTVLPTIRKTGTFSVDVPRTLAHALLLAAKLETEREEAVLLALEAKAAVVKQLAVVAEKESVISAQAPKVAGYDRFVNTSGYITWQNASIALGLPANKLSAWMRSKGLTNKDNSPTAKLSNKKWDGKAIMRSVPVEDRTGRIRMHCYLTAAGVALMSFALDKNGVERNPAPETTTDFDLEDLL